jgi:hypothetical protein
MRRRFEKSDYKIRNFAVPSVRSGQKAIFWQSFIQAGLSEVAEDSFLLEKIFLNICILQGELASRFQPTTSRPAFQI